MSEQRITSATGGQKGQKPCRLGAVDPLSLIELGNVAGMGEEKYDRFNYLKGYAWSLNVDAAFRHLLLFLAGEDRDPESGLLHTAHAMWHMGALTSFQLRQIGTDDRAPLPPIQYNPAAPAHNYVDWEDCTPVGMPSVLDVQRAAVEGHISMDEALWLVGVDDTDPFVWRP